MSESWIAIAISFLTFGWVVYRDLMREGRIRLTCYVGEIITVGVGKDPTTYLVWSYVNSGAESIVVQHVGGSLDNGHEFLLNRPGSVAERLAPFDSRTERAPLTSIFSERVTELWIMDTLGRKFKASKHDLRKIRKSYLNLKNLETH